MIIQYCDRCGKRISPSELETKQAAEREGRFFCAACLPAEAPAAPPSRKSPNETSVVPGAGKGSTARRAGGRAPDPRDGKNVPLQKPQPFHPAILIALGSVVILPVLYFLLRSPAPSKPAHETRVVPPAPPPALPAPTPAPVATPAVPAVPAGPRPPLTPETKTPDADDLAEQAFADLTKFAGLAEDDTAGKIARIEAFLTKHGDAIVSSRARVLLQRLKNPAAATGTPAPPVAAPVNAAIPRTLNLDFENGKAPGFSEVFAKLADDPTQSGRGKVLSGNVNNDGMRARLCDGDYPGDSEAFRAGAVFVASEDFKLSFKYFITGGYTLRVTLNRDAETPAYHAKLDLKKDQWTEAVLTRADFHFKDDTGDPLPAETPVRYVNWWVYPGNEVKAMYLDDIKIEGSAPPKPADPKALLESVVAKLKELNPGYDGQTAGTEVKDGRPATLVIVSDKISRIDPVADLKGLTKLGVSGTYNAKGILSDLSALKGLPLEELTLNMQPQIADLSALQGMPLHTLSLNGMSCSDLTPLKGLPLTTLNLASSKVGDLSPIKGMKLEHMNLAGSMVKDLSPLEGMPLKSLTLAYLGVADLSPLKGMKLTYFVYGHPAATDFSALAEMPLETLNLNGSSVSDLGFIKDMPLRSLLITRTKVTDLSPLKGKQIKSIQLTDCAIKDFTPLHDLPLQEIVFDLDLKRDAEWLKAIKTLKAINNKPAAAVLAGN
ncbi:MAG: hypothetical protein KIS92_19780 [Planctomycetota bacterium]|nr:hypothetical protein [Planctomycetota bacterium]